MFSFKPTQLSGNYSNVANCEGELMEMRRERAGLKSVVLAKALLEKAKE